MAGTARRLSILAVALLDDRAGGVDVGHQLPGVTVADIWVVAFRQLEIGGGEFPLRQRGDIDPQASEQQKCLAQAHDARLVVRAHRVASSSYHMGGVVETGQLPHTPPYPRCRGSPSLLRLQA